MPDPQTTNNSKKEPTSSMNRYVLPLARLLCKQNGGKWPCGQAPNFHGAGKPYIENARGIIAGMESLIKKDGKRITKIPRPHKKRAIND